jgi:hypothetical protein
MNIDRYTKCVLTVIAGCLLWICVMGSGSPLAAQGPFRTFSNANVQPVVLVGTGTLDQAGTVTVAYARQAGSQWVTDPTIPVALPYTAARPLPVGLPYTAANPMPSQLSYTPNAPLPIEIAAVRKTGEWEPIRARVEDAPTRKLPGGGDR